jgi:hypothetical protein
MFIRALGCVRPTPPGPPKHPMGNFNEHEQLNTLETSKRMCSFVLLNNKRNMWSTYTKNMVNIYKKRGQTSSTQVVKHRQKLKTKHQTRHVEIYTNGKNNQMSTKTHVQIFKHVIIIKTHVNNIKTSCKTSLEIIKIIKLK